MGELETSCNYARQGAELYNRDRHRQHMIIYGTDPGVFCRSRYAQTSCLLGYADRAVQEAATTIHLAKQLEHPYSLAFAWLNSAQVDVFRRHGEHAFEAIEQGQAIATEQVFPFLIYWAHFLQIWALASAGHKQQAVNLLDEVLRDPLPESKIIRGYLYLYLAEIYYLLALPEKGLAVLAAADDEYEIVHRAERRRLQGEFLLMQSNEAEAIACFNQAISISEALHTRIYGLRAVLSLAQLQQSSHKATGIHQFLHKYYQELPEAPQQIDWQEMRDFLKLHPEDNSND